MIRGWENDKLFARTKRRFVYPFIIIKEQVMIKLKPWERDHAPIDSEIFALLDSIKAAYVVENGIVYVTTHNGELWDFTIPKRRPE